MNSRLQAQGNHYPHPYRVWKRWVRFPTLQIMRILMDLRVLNMYVDKSLLRPESHQSASNFQKLLEGELSAPFV